MHDLLTSNDIEIITVNQNLGDLQVNIASEYSVKDLYEKVRPFDGLICVAGRTYAGPLDKMGTEETYKGIKSKLMSKVNLVVIGK